MLTSVKDARFLERLGFFDRQRLLAADLQALESFNRQMRWLHNQSLHQPGIGSGYAISGKKGDREVTITPGYALDADGREIILTAQHIEPVPPVAGGAKGKPALFDLAVSYPSDDNLKETEMREGACQSRGAVRRREEPVFCWIALNDDGSEAANLDLKKRLEEGMLIVLGRVAIENCQLKRDVSIAQRRNARPSRQPRIACGTASPVWREIPNGGGNRSFSYEADVGTTSGGFAATPSYTARVRSDDWDWQEILLFSLVTIEKPRATNFTIRLFLLTANFDAPPTNIPVQVVWMGVEA